MVKRPARVQDGGGPTGATSIRATIPVDIAKALDLKKGDTIIWELKDQTACVTKL